MLVFSLALLLRVSRPPQILQAAPATFFVVSIFLVTGMGAFWFSAIMGTSPRFILALIVPYFWTLGLVVHGQPLDLPAVVGMGLIVAGVTGISLWSGSQLQ